MRKVHSAYDVGDVVRAARKAAGLTQRELSEVCGCGVRFLSDLENGKPTIELDKAIHLLNTLSIDVCLGKRSFS